jgi:predicted nuclease of restriction endonuclease-like (RecB) superfamily
MERQEVEGWGRNPAILERCKDWFDREFYLCMTRDSGWARHILIHQIDNQSCEKSLLGQTNFNQTLIPELRCHRPETINVLVTSSIIS